MKSKLTILLNENQYRQIFNENQQLADKVYFKTGLLDNDAKEMIMSVTGGDNYTKLIADVYYFLVKDNPYKTPSYDDVRKLYLIIKNYDKNVFPIKDFNKPLDNKNISEFVNSLYTREKLIQNLKEIPSIGIRNLKNDIRQERNWGKLTDYLDKLEYLTTHLGFLNNREDDIKDKIYQKIFKSDNTIDKMLNFVEDKENLIGGVETSMEEILNLVDEHPDMKLMYNQNNILVVRIESAQAIKAIGCNSLWCFTYGSGFHNASRDWNSYSTDDTVYVIINFNESQDSTNFMNVLIKPLDYKPLDDEDNDEKLYDMSNNAKFDALSYIKSTIGLKTAKKLFTFDWD